MPGRIGIPSSAIDEYPVRTGFTETKRPPRRSNAEIAIFNAFEGILGGAWHDEELRANEIRDAKRPSDHTQHDPTVPMR